jgi:hypothetical protein
MSPEQQGGAVAATGFVAEPAGSAADSTTVKHAPTCANCGVPVPDRFCGRCGQRLEHALHSVVHFSQEVTEDLTHADSRLWSTMLALLFKPGFLTHEFIAGRRVRYLPPLRLYLVLSAIFFLVMSLHPEREPIALTVDDSGGSLQVKPANQVEQLAAKPGETNAERDKRVCDAHYDGPGSRFVTPFLQKGCKSYLNDGGRAATEAFRHTLPRAMFFLLPALALVMKPLYWRPRHYYIEHLLFFLHNHAFGFLIFTVLLLVTRYAPQVVGHWAKFLLLLYIPYYLFVSLRRVYGQGRVRTFMKLIVLSFAYFTLAMIALTMTGVYSVYAQ